MAQRVASLYAEIGADTGGLDKGLARAKTGLQDTANSAKSTGTHFTEMASQLGVAQQAFGMTANAAKQVWDVFEQGQAMELASGRLDNLTASIGTTSDALTGELTAATSGMMSNAEQIASATQIISLGLADTQEEVVDLASLTSQLGWDMQQVIMTFANDSAMRLDALGLSVEDVTKRQKALEEQGIATSEAFDMAVIEAGKAKLELLGSAADTGAGGMARLEVKLVNVKDAMLGIIGTRTEGVWSGLANVIDTVSSANNDLKRAYEMGYISQAQYLKGMIDVNTIASDNHDVLNDARDALGEYDATVTNASYALDGFTQSQDAARIATNDTTDALGDYSNESLYATQAQDAAIATTHAYIAAQLKAEESEIARAAASEKTTATILAARDAENAATATMGDFFTAALNNNDALVKYQKNYITTGGLFEDQQANLDELSSAYQNHQQKIESLESGTAGLGMEQDKLNEALAKEYEAMALIETRMNPLLAVTEETKLASEGWVVNQDAVNASLYEAADAAGASATELALLGLATGELTALQAEQALKSAAVASEIERMGEAIANGMDPAEAMASVQTFIEELNSTDFSVQLGLELEEQEGKTREKQDEVVKGLENISAASFTTGSDLTSMSIQAETDLETLRLSFDANAESVDRNAASVGKLKNEIIDGLPNEKVVTIRIVTVGSVPNIPGGSSSGTSASGAPPEFATGGTVPGPMGMPQMIVAHGGEEVLTMQQQKERNSPSINISFAGAIFQGTTQQQANQMVSMVAEQLGR